MKFVTIIALLIEATLINSQSFLNATSRYTQLSDFRQLLISNPVVAGSLLTNTTTNNTLTILVPSKTAFDEYRKANNNTGVDSLSSAELTNVLNYHTLQGALSSSDLQKDTGLIANSALTNPMYANRELSSDGSKKPQVVYIGTNGSNLIQARQLSSSGAGQYVESGEGRTVNVDPTDGVWDGGRFHIIDGFLTLPLNQTNTMTAQGLNSFVRGLDRTNVTVGTNAAPGLTCVCPNDRAFADYGALDMSTGNLTDGPASLLATLTRHGLTGSFYTTDFFNGQMIHSQNGYPIRVTNRNGTIFLNDAQIVGTNYIANNGAVHALDRVKPLNFVKQRNSQSLLA
ncbi:MAG: hypothetical protein M1836_001449 [Candelina mexicana]|nr:MAG: hypothetical protein M1836_001449 [Candelina mexicana]